jgi:LL-diaminopimelate aminotransferase
MKSSAERMTHLGAHFFATREARLAELRAAGADVIHLDVGSPDLPPPQNVVEVLSRSAEKADHHGYQPYRGTVELRQAWADIYKRIWGVNIDPNHEIIPLLGSKEGIFHLNLAFIQQGDIALAPDPGYMTYRRGALFAGGEVYTLELDSSNHYLPDFESIPSEILMRAKLLWLNYPNNPTSAVASLNFFEQVVNFAHQHQLIICHDAAYSRVTYDGEPAPSILQVPGAMDVAVEFNTLSKSHNMAGWRSAALFGNRHVVGTLYQLKSNADSSHFLPIFDASVAALGTDQAWLDQRNSIYRERRDAMINGLKALEIIAAEPSAGLYIWVSTPNGWSSIDFSDQALENAHVSITPGEVFGPNGAGFLRFTLTASVERINEAMGRLGDWMEARL